MYLYQRMITLEVVIEYFPQLLITISNRSGVASQARQGDVVSLRLVGVIGFGFNLHPQAGVLPDRHHTKIITGSPFHPHALEPRHAFLAGNVIIASKNAVRNVEYIVDKLWVLARQAVEKSVAQLRNRHRSYLKPFRHRR